MDLLKGKLLKMNKQAYIILSLFITFALLSCNNENKDKSDDNNEVSEISQQLQDVDSLEVADTIENDTIELVQYSKDEVDRYVDSVNRLKETRVYRTEYIISERNIWEKEEISAPFVCYYFDSLNNYISVDYSDGNLNVGGISTLYKFDNNGNCYYNLPPECSYIGAEYIKDNQVIYSTLREGDYGERLEVRYKTYEFEPPFDFNIYKEQILRNYQFAFIDSRNQLCFYESTNKSIIISKEKYPVTDLYFDDFNSRKDGNSQNCRISKVETTLDYFYSRGITKDLYYNITKDNELYFRILDLNIHSDVTNTFMTRILNYDVFDKDKNSIKQVKDNYQNSVMNELTCLKGDISKMSFKHKKAFDENICSKISFDSNKIYYDTGEEKICPNDKLVDFNEIVDFNVLCVSNKKESILYSAIDSQGEGSVFFATLDGKVQFKLDGCDCNRHNAGFLNDDNIIFNNDKGIHLLKANSSKVIRTFSGKKFVIINR